MQLDGIEGRVALVTRGSRGIGRRMIERFRELGAKTAVLDLEPEAIDGVLSIATDVADEASVDRAIGEVERVLGAPQLVVLNAGVLHKSPIEEHSLSDWQRVLDVNLTGPFLVPAACSEACERPATEGSSSSARAPGSTASEQLPRRSPPTRRRRPVRWPSPSRSRWSTRPHGVTANALAPTLIDTGMLSTLTTDFRFDDPARSLRPARGGCRPRGLPLLRLMPATSRARSWISTAATSSTELGAQGRIEHADLRTRSGREGALSGGSGISHRSGESTSSPTTRGTRAACAPLQVNTGGGLRFSVHPDRGMDVGRAEFAGIGLSLPCSEHGLPAPWYYEGKLDDYAWLRVGLGGLFNTAGLVNDRGCLRRSRPTSTGSRSGMTEALRHARAHRGHARQQVHARRGVGAATAARSGSRDSVREEIAYGENLLAAPPLRDRARLEVVP